MLNNYEAILLAPGDYDEDTANHIYEEYKERIGSLSKKYTSEFWGNKKLAYPVGKQTYGWYYDFNFVTTEEKMEELEELINHDASIMKHIIVVKEKDIMSEEDLAEYADFDTKSPEHPGKSEQNHEPDKKPAVDVFDLIFGTS